MVHSVLCWCRRFGILWGFGRDMGLWFARCVLLPMAGMFALAGFVAAMLTVRLHPYAAPAEPAKGVVLDAGQWVCTQLHTKIVTSMILSGKVLVPTTYPVSECVVYSKKQ